MSEKLKFVYAKKEDTPVIYDMIKGLAEYENLLDQVNVNQETLKDWIFEKKIAEVIFIELENKKIGFALLFYNFSTFLGKAGLYIEDLFIYPEYRGKGYGKKLFKEIAGIALKRGCGRVDWSCLDWNTPSINFYKSIGAKVIDGWSSYRLGERELLELSK